MTYKFKLTQIDPRTVELMRTCDHRVLGLWARDCARRVLPFFATQFPTDRRPQNAIITLKDWIDTGEFSMKVIRAASLSAHAAAREVGVDNAARSAARSAGQAVATAHVRTHSLAAALYALQAISRASENPKKDVERERDWQYEHLLVLKNL